MFARACSEQSCFDSLLNLRERLIQLAHTVLGLAGPQLGSRQSRFRGSNTGLRDIQSVLGSFSAPFCRAEFLERVSAKTLGTSFDLPRLIL